MPALFKVQMKSSHEYDLWFAASAATNEDIRNWALAPHRLANRGALLFMRSLHLKFQISNRKFQISLASRSLSGLEPQISTFKFPTSNLQSPASNLQLPPSRSPFARAPTLLPGVPFGRPRALAKTSARTRKHCVFLRSPYPASMSD